MKNAHSLTVLKACTTVFLCASFAFFTSASAQTGAAKKLQEIKEFRAHCTEMLSALPTEKDVQASSVFSPTEKQKLLSAIKTFEDGSQIKDNASDATFSKLKKNVEGVENWLLTFQPSGAPSAAKANDSPSSGLSPLEECKKGCRTALDTEQNDCKKLGGTKKDRAVCNGRAIGKWMACTTNCHLQ